jgi:hypothetical protein
MHSVDRNYITYRHGVTKLVNNEGLLPEEAVVQSLRAYLL